jgi:hypothetical protein
MKTKVILLALLGLFMVRTASAQKNVIKINPLSLGLLTINMQYERALNEKMSLQLGSYYTGFSFTIDGEKSGYKGFGITPEFRYYASHLKKEAPRGFFVGPFFRYQNWNIKTEYDDGSGNTVTDSGTFQSYKGGVILGYQWLIGDVFALEFFGGPSVGGSTVSGDVEDGDVRGAGISGVGFRAGMALGVAF